MLRSVALILLWTMAACSGAARPPAPRDPSRSLAELQAGERLNQSLSDCKTAEELRANLAAGLSRQELARIGFDEVSLAQCIELLIPAILAYRARPEDPAARERLGDTAGQFLVAQREAMVRRTAGAASCLPTMR
jgi:hypothetical protein